MKTLIKILGAIFFVIIFGIIMMFIFQICPPEGPWIMPPWCSKSKESVNFNREVDNNSLVDDNNSISQKNEIKEETQKDEVLKDKIKEETQKDEVLKDKTQEEKKIENDFPGITRANFQKGVVFGAMKWSKDEKRYIQKGIDALNEFNVGWIAIVPEWFVFPDQNGTEIKPFYESMGKFPNSSNWITPTLSDDELIGIIKKAKQKGIKVVLKPQIDPIDFGVKSGSSRGSLHPSDWDLWFSNYKKFILHYAQLASQEGVKMLIIGTELDTAVREMPQATLKWNNLIKEIRKVYSGSLTYSASCYGECWSPRQVGFWNNLDYIGFEPYFSLTHKNNPSVEEMKTAFDEKLNKYAKALFNRYHKPVIITEANVYSYDGVNQHPIDPPGANALPDSKEQADYYEALFRSIQDKEWIEGIYWWAWYLKSTDSHASYLNDLYDPFVRKPAGEVLKKWY